MVWTWDPQVKHIKLFWYGWILGDTLDGRNLPPGFIYSARLPSTKGAPSRIFTQVKLMHIYIYTHYRCIFYIYILKNIYDLSLGIFRPFHIPCDVSTMPPWFHTLFKAPAPKVPREGEEPVFFSSTPCHGESWKFLLFNSGTPKIVVPPNHPF